MFSDPPLQLPTIRCKGEDASDAIDQTDYTIVIHWPRMIRKAKHFGNYTAVVYIIQKPNVWAC